MLSHVDATRIVARRYEDALAEIARLTRRNRELEETLRANELKALRLVGHYKGEIAAQTNLARGLRDELRAGEERARAERRRTTRDRGTMVDGDELRSREQEYIAVIDLLEDEIRALKEDQAQRARDFERQSLVHQANVKQSFFRDVDVLRQQVSASVCGEVRDALAATIADNERLTREFRRLLGETEQLQASRDQKDRALRSTKRELEFLAREKSLWTRKEQDQRTEEPCVPLETAKESPREEQDEEVNDDDSVRERKRSGLEEYFRQCIKNAKESC